jgi:hypothetical protein
MMKPPPAKYDEAKAKARFDESLSRPCKLTKMTATMKRRALRRKPGKKTAA